MIEALREQGMETHLIHRRDSLSKIFEKEISDSILSKMKENKVKLHLSKNIKQIEDTEDFVSIYTDKDIINTDFVILAIGVSPNTNFCKDTGIKLGIKNSVKVNEFLQTNYNYIYSAGDCAETTNIITGEKVFTPLALKANREGMLVGLNISGSNEKFAGVTETAITKIFNIGIARTGITLERALKLGLDAVKFNFLSGTKARYYPNSERIKSYVIIERGTGKVLGAQLVGPLDSVKRIDVWATAIYNKMTLNDVFNLDLAYSPPFSPVWDPVILAARIGKKHI